jgi:hypothetical protein
MKGIVRQRGLYDISFCLSTLWARIANPRYRVTYFFDDYKLQRYNIVHQSILL